MALIKCSGCGQMISDKAFKCPKCGTPVSLVQPSNQQMNTADSYMYTEESSSKKWLYPIIGILAIALLGLASWIFLINDDKQNQTEQIVGSSSMTDVESNGIDLSDNETVGRQPMNLHGYVGKYPVTMHLEFDNNIVNGYYFYNSGSSKLQLTGTINNNHIELNETTQEGRPTGHFSGKMINGEYSGEFINYKGEHFNFSVSSSGVTKQTDNLSRQNDMQNDDDMENPYGISDEEMFEIQSQRLHERAMELEEE